MVCHPSDLRLDRGKRLCDALETPALGLHAPVGDRGREALGLIVLPRVRLDNLPVGGAWLPATRPMRALLHEDT